MSKFMLDDDAAIDGVNPYTTFDFSLPGTSRNPESKDSIVTNSKGVHFREPLTDEIEPRVCGCGNPECSLSRPLIPGRNIDKGFTNPNKSVHNDVEVFNYELKVKEVFPYMLTAITIITFLSLIILAR